MTTTTQVDLVINKLTQAQYNSATKEANQLYMVTDAVLSSSDVTTALGYTPENQANKVTSISGSSTDTQYPSAKCVYDALQNAGSSRNIGEIVQSTIPLTDAGLHLLDGSLLTYGSYSAFIDYIDYLFYDGSYDDLFETEANWQTSVTNYGVCGKFVYDENDMTVRLPKITGFTEGTIDPTVLGDLVEAGLPNITGSVVGNTTSGTTYGFGEQQNGAFKVTNNGYKAYGAGSPTDRGALTLDASRSSSIYGNSSTVQPQAIKVLYYIVIATSTKTQIQVDLDQIATDLNGKADVDLTNVNDSGTSLSAGWAMPSTTYEDLTLGASGTEYTAPANGWFHLNKQAQTAGKYALISGSRCSVESPYVGQYKQARLIFPVLKGDVVRVDYDLDGSTYSWRFIYAKGSESEAS